jgi:hypothetical protein
MDQEQVDQLEDQESMFVQTAGGFTSDGATVTLQDVTSATLYFSDRPQRVVGHMATADFVDLWDEGDNSFAVDPPNAVLAFVQADAEAPADARRRAALLHHEGPRGDGAGPRWAGHPLHRPVRTTAVPRFGVRRPPTRAAAGPSPILTATASITN